MSNTCLTCRFWKSPYGLDHPYVETQSGECRRHAPTRRTTSEHGHSSTDWPTMPAVGWCGEHEQAPKPINGCTGPCRGGRRGGIKHQDCHECQGFDTVAIEAKPPSILQRLIARFRRKSAKSPSASIEP